MDVLQELRKLGIHDAMLENFTDSVKEGPKSIPFTEIISWLSKELQAVCNLECCVNSITDPNDSSTFLVEVSSFLKEMACPHQCLIEGPVSQRLLSDMNKMLLLSFLTSELCAARIIFTRKPMLPQAMVVEMQESDTAKIIKEMLIALGFSKPPPDITPVKLFTKIEAKLKDLVNKYSALEIGEPLFTGTLTAKQWFALEKLQAEMFEEYAGRRNTLLMRLDVTVMSFSWSERLKNSDAKIAQVYNARRQKLSVTPSVHIADLLAARKDLVVVEKTSNASVRKNTKSSVNKVVIGSVPDRGGRPEEQQPPPPEVPSWQKNEPPKSNFSGNFGGGRSEKRPQSDGYSTQANVSGFSGYQNKSAPQHNNYGSQGKSYNYSNVQTEYVPQPSYGNYGSGGNFSSNRSDYRYQPQGAGNLMQGGADFGLGFGGYGATGGNFQQYGFMPQPADDQDMYRNRGGGRGRSSRGGRGGGGGRRGGRGGGDYYGGSRQY